MISLTIGYVSGIIAAVVFLLQFLFPNALIVVLVGFLKNEQTAVTWSVVERSLLSSSWPTILRTDAAATRGVDTKIRLLTWLRPLALGLVSVAAVVTPLGLYDDIVPAGSTQSVAFAYVPDTGPMGYGTPPRSELGFSRVCGAFLPVQCPGTTSVITYSGNDTFMEANITNNDYDTRIPEVLAKLYQSGLDQQPQSVASFFDIQSRYYSFMYQDGVARGGKYIVDAFRYLSSMVLDNAIEPVEGLVVDTVTGGVGFRNHTAPVGVDLGAEWTEDLLWIQPESACVDTNVSVEFQIPYNGIASDDLTNISLVDNGGFANLVPKYPYVNVTNSQVDPNLQGRAYKAAWMVNAYTMLVMNLTRPSPDAFAYLKSKVGNKYPVTKYQTTGVKLNGIYVSSTWTSMLDPEAYLSNYTLANVPSANYSNPFGLTTSNYSDISLVCSGAGGADLAKLTNVHVECGMVFGAAKRRDGTITLVQEPETWWTQKIYSCATAMKASIKEVRFRYNATQQTGNDLKALSIVNVSDKSYSDKEAMPLWGIESPEGYEMSNLPQLWGLISPELEHSVNLSTIRAPQLYLPGYGGSGILSTVPGFENLPGSDGPADTLAGVYQYTSDDSADYTGTTNMAMYARWRDLSETAATMAKIPNLVWTDIAANMLVGTRSWNSGKKLPANLQKRDDDGPSTSSSDQAIVPVSVYRRQIRYHWQFAIPAFLALGLFLVVLLAALVSVVSGRGLPARVRHYLFHLSSGRMLGEMQYAGECDKLAPTNEWLARVGSRRSDLRAYVSHNASGVSGSNGPGIPTSPFLGQQYHMASGMSEEKLKGIASETTELRHLSMAASGHAKGVAPAPGYMRLGENEQAGWRSPAL
ncbi:uncharacterized protein PV07_00523 [Cladophialophora immunda]|uniref:Uncharacterized protein n=1 Tax=Cladophialophora immunda TaxID=569365 RepID=A0A0D2CUY0_9EURO|nr:uncharacterized protein PV07_00523 [Cladophialophora immunda]KIW33695.1 hypothetical protein PV07_00523 [Cladophialophora immunda]OQU94178.1 hypothetical protein CLAIMM_00572 [Cladophialophora immunda]